MPELKPTLAFAVVNRLGSEFDGMAVCAETDHESARLRFPLSIKYGKAEVVPCLILPAPRPIEQCPEEWKDGRNVWLFKSESKCWVKAYWDTVYSWWESSDSDLDDRDVSHVMLPPPAPQEAPNAR